MRIEKTLAIGETEIAVRELTVADIRAWLKALEAQTAPDVLDVVLFEDFTLADLTRMTDLTAADLETMAPSELRRVADACREVNADFFALRGRLLTLGQAALATPAAS